MKRNYPLVEFNYDKLNGRIIEKFGTRSNFADALNTSKQYVSLKLNNKISFGQSEIKLWCNLLEIPDDEVGFYFFAPKVYN